MDWMLMPLRRYADFSGRSRRMEFWMWQVFKFLCVVVLWVIMFALIGSAAMSGDAGAMMAMGGVAMIVWLIAMLFGLAILIPDIAVAVRRLHDTNRTGWWILAPVAPYLVAVVSAVIGGASGTQSGMVAGGVIGLLAMLVALGLAITLLVFYFMEGTRGPNRYGPDPKGANTGEVFA